MAVRWTRLSVADQVLSDRLLAATILVVGQVEIWTLEGLGGYRWVSSAAVVVASVALLYRRRAPLTTMAVASLAFAVHLVGVRAAGHDPASVESAALVAIWVVPAYSVAAHATLARAAIGLVIAAALPIGYAAASDSAELEPINLLFVLVPWAAGRALRHQRAQAKRLEQLAHDLAHEREERERSAVNEERARIARELHDIVAHSVSVIAVQADAAEGALARDPALAAAPLAAVKGVARDTLAELRRAVGVLRENGSAALSPRPGLDLLPALVDQARQGGLSVELRVHGTRRALPAGVDLSAYRIVQEALTNVRKHARTDRATVEVTYDDGSVSLDISDDGVGPPAEPPRGHGLLGIRERVALYDGTLSTGPGSGGGFAVRAVLRTEGSVP